MRARRDLGEVRGMDNVSLFKRIGFTALMQAANLGDVGELEALVVESAGAVNEVDVDGRYSLWFAANRGHLSCVQRLLEAGAEPDRADRFGETPLMRAPTPATFATLWLAGANPDRRGWKGRPSWVKFEHRPEKLGRVLALIERQSGEASQTGALLRLWGAWRCRDVARFETLLEGVAAMLELDVRAFLGRNPVWWAASLGSMRSLALLHGRGWSLDLCDDFGQTPLHEAVFRNRPKIVSWLGQHGASPSAVEGYGRTALTMAVQRGEPEMVRRLLDLGAEVDQRDEYGRTALFFACKLGRSAAGRALVDAGADPEASGGRSHGRPGLARRVPEGFDRNLADLGLIDYREVIATCCADIRGNSEGAEPYSRRALARYHLGDFRGAVGDFTCAIEREPRLAEAYFFRALCHHRLKRHAKARDDYERSVELEPRLKGAHRWRSDVGEYDRPPWL